MQAFISGFPQSPVEYLSPLLLLFLPAPLPLSITSGIVWKGKKGKRKKIIADGREKGKHSRTSMLMDGPRARGHLLSVLTLDGAANKVILVVLVKPNASFQRVSLLLVGQRDLCQGSNGYLIIILQKDSDEKSASLLMGIKVVTALYSPCVEGCIHTGTVFEWTSPVYSCVKVSLIAVQCEKLVKLHFWSTASRIPTDSFSQRC